MATNHTGDPMLLNLPSPVPAPGAVPIVEDPSDGDSLNADSVKQGLETAADFVAHIQGAVRLERPATSSTTSGVGFMFTTPVHSGTGTGTVKPSAGIALAGYRYRVLIVAPGAVGTATFQVSTDGGKTFGGVQTTVASYSDPSGITIAFSGTFVATDTYDWRGVDAPLAMWSESSGRARELVDHMGFKMGQVSTFREDWTSGATGAFAANTNDFFPGNARWKYQLGTASPNPTLVTTDPGTSDMNGNFQTQLFTGSTQASTPTINNIRTSKNILAALPDSTACFAIQGLVRNPFASANQALYFGLLGNVQDHFSQSHATGVCFHASGTGNWFASSFVFGSATSVDTGITPNSGSGADWQLLRIEYYGDSSRVGIAFGGQNVIRFLIDGEQVAILSGTNAGDGALFSACAELTDQGNATADKFEVGPIAWSLNWLDDPVRM